MQKYSTGIKIFAIMLIVNGFINLLGFVGYNDFKLLCRGFPQAIIFIIYIFGIGYGVMSILCGSKILKLEEWARKTAVILVMISLILGLFVNSTMFKNLEAFYIEKQQFGITLDMLTKSYIFSAIIFTVFELFFVYFFTRPKVREQFK